MIECGVCMRWTHGINGMCPNCYSDRYAPLSEEREHVVSFMRAMDQECRMAFIRRQLDAINEANK